MKNSEEAGEKENIESAETRAQQKVPAIRQDLMLLIFSFEKNYFFLAAFLAAFFGAAFLAAFLGAAFFTAFFGAAFLAAFFAVAMFFKI
ncbi:MAG TPA: hypothetical protein PLY34_01320 [Ferruginibacter sp.]|nr:hypothetical protein [Ferruginibacter sp.]HPH90047.1 hypothetical protein [Ferruginibacter sp.]